MTPPHASEPVLVSDLVDGVLTLALNRPHKRNALNRELWSALHDAVAAASANAQLRVLIITGRGGAFCSGNDMSDGGPDAHPLDRMRVVNETAQLVHELRVPTVAVVDGPAYGAGWNLALGCDLVVATPGSSFCQVFAKVGLSIDFGGSWLLPKLVGLQQAKRLTLLAEPIDAAEAHALGLVTWIVAAEELEPFVADLAGRLAAGPPVALALTKALLNEGTTRSMRDALAGEARAQAVNLATDAAVGYQAFLNRTDPVFTGAWQRGQAPA